MRWSAFAVILALAIVGCYTRHAPTPLSKANERFPRTRAAFQQVRGGMEQGEVQVILGPPDTVDAVITPWGWLTFLPGSWKYIYHYRGLGRVTFSCSAFNLAGSVSTVEPE